MKRETEELRGDSANTKLCPLNGFALIIAFLAPALLIAGCFHESAKAPAPAPSLPPTSVATGAADTKEFVGDTACQSCHRLEFKRHAGSRHAITLHRAVHGELGSHMPPMGRVPGTDIVLTERQGAIQMTLAGQPGDALPIDLAFGSGKTGMTYVAFLGMEALELHKSYFPGLRQWYLTPGHEKQKPTDVGMLHKRDITRECVLCHAVTMPDDGSKPEKRFFGVGCESCHGAGGAHVAAMKSGKPGELFMERLGRLDASHLNDLCGNCHRGVGSLNLSTNQASMTNRFQAYGLMKSRCYVDSGGRISCITCHNPHTNASTDPKTYEKVCLSCHSESKTVSNPTPSTQGHICPVNRTSGCTQCHMPKRSAFVTNDVPTRMADHFIHIAAK